jgi:hypothetical protein
MSSPRQPVRNFCPVCGEELDLASINIAEGVALCASCGQLSRLSDVVSRKRPLAEVLSSLPKGCSIADLGDRILVRATSRSLGTFLGALAVALFWNGIVSIFVLIAIAGLWKNLVGPIPAWFPAPQMQNAMGLGETLFLCIFLLPFVGIGSVLLAALVLSAAGKVEVSVGADQADASTGLGFLVWRRRFDPTKVRLVTIGKTGWESNDQAQPVIVIEANRTIKFGGLLTEERREWMQAVVHQLSINSKPQQRRELVAAITGMSSTTFGPA